MKSRHIDTGCRQGRIGDESMLISRAILMYPLRWFLSEIRTWGSFEWIAALYCVVIVCIAWFGGQK